MNNRWLRLVYALEFLVAMVAIFTSWSEIGGQAALDMMHWGFKLGFSLVLATAIVGYTAAAVRSESIWMPGPLRWLAIVSLLLAGMGVVTYFYSIQADAGQTDEGGTLSVLRSRAGTSHRT